jgi:hypothetical protein
MRTSSYTATELETVDRWAAKAKQERNFNDTPEVGQALLQTCGDAPITEALLESAATAMQASGWSVFRSNDEMSYNAAYDALPQSGKDAFAAWWGKGQSIDKSARNAVLLINWCAGRGVTQDNLNLALGNLATRGLIIVNQPYEYHGGIHSGKNLRDEVPLSERTDALGNRLYPGREPSEAARQWEEKEAREAAQGRGSTIPDAEWQRRAESVDSNLNSTRQALKRIFVTRPDKTTIDWKSTYEARYQFAGSGDGRGSGKSV